MRFDNDILSSLFALLDNESTGMIMKMERKKAFQFLRTVSFSPAPTLMPLPKWCGMV